VLEARGFIERNRDELDRRAQLVTLTPRGREVYLPIAEIGEEINAYATSILTSKERTAMENPLRKVIEYLQNLQSANSMGTAE